MPIPATGTWASNAELIADVAALGFLRRDWVTLDCTYKLGTFWKAWAPDTLVRTDLDPLYSHDHPGGCDVRALPFVDGRFDSVVVDLPYKFSGTATPDVDGRYGVKGGEPWKETMALLADGMTGAARVYNGTGCLLFKCQDQVVSSKIRWQTIHVNDAAEACGLGLVARFNMIGGRAQPPKRRQVNPANNTSQLLIYRRDHNWRPA